MAGCYMAIHIMDFRILEITRISVSTNKIEFVFVGTPVLHVKPKLPVIYNELIEPVQFAQPEFFVFDFGAKKFCMVQQAIIFQTCSKERLYLFKKIDFGRR